MKSIALTGASSMLGAALIRECITHNVQVYAFVRPGSKNLDRIPQSDLIAVLECDMDDLLSFDADGINADVFYHIGWSFTDKAGRNSCDKQLKNVQYTLDAVQLAERLRCRRFIGTGSQAEYGLVDTVIHPGTPVRPETPYGIAKYSAGQFSRLMCESLRMQHVWVRVFSVYGKNDNSGTLVSSLIANVKQGIPMPLTKCEQIWDYLYEDDAGRALFLLGDRPSEISTSKIYCLGSGIGIPLIEYLQTLVRLVDPDYKLCLGELPYTEKTVMNLTADISDLTRDTGWKPVVDFAQGIRRILEDE